MVGLSTMFNRMQFNASCLVVDTRDEAEYRRRHIKRALNLPRSLLEVPKAVDEGSARARLRAAWTKAVELARAPAQAGAQQIEAPQEQSTSAGSSPQGGPGATDVASGSGSSDSTAVAAAAAALNLLAETAGTRRAPRFDIRRSYDVFVYGDGPHDANCDQTAGAGGAREEGRDDAAAAAAAADTAAAVLAWTRELVLLLRTEGASISVSYVEGGADAFVRRFPFLTDEAPEA